jgi:hypothetical protein
MQRHRSLLRLWLFLVLAAPWTTTACAAASAPRRGPGPLPPDSLAVLTAALRQARPAFPTQGEALRSGVYRTGAGSAPVTNEQRDQSTVTEAASAYVIQIAAYGDRSLAEQARARAQVHFPTRTILVEQAGDVYRLAIAGWPSPAAATADLRPVQRIYPGAWVRVRAVP